MTDTIPTPTSAPSLPGMPPPLMANAAPATMPPGALLGIPGMPPITMPAAVPPPPATSQPMVAAVPPPPAAAPPPAYTQPPAPQPEASIQPQPTQPPIQEVPMQEAQQYIPAVQPTAAPIAPPIAQPAQQMAVAQPAQQMAVAQPAPTQQMSAVQLPLDAFGFPTEGSIKEQMQAIGMGAVNLDMYGVLPTITLAQNEFSKDKALFADNFRVRIGDVRNKYLYAYGVDGSNDYKLMYTYDNYNDANSEQTLPEFQAAAAAANFQVKKTEYYEIPATLLDTGELVNLSVPVRGSGTAVARLVMQAMSVRRRPQDAEIRVKKGEVVRSGKHPFTPWAFEIVGWLR